jgi:hypothetical protein
VEDIRQIATFDDKSLFIIRLSHFDIIIIANQIELGFGVGG